MSVLNAIRNKSDLNTAYAKAPKAKTWENFISYIDGKLNMAIHKPYPRAKKPNGFPKSFIRERATPIEDDQMGTITHTVKIPEANKPLPLSDNSDDVVVFATSLGEARVSLGELVALIKSPNKNSVNSAVVAELENREYTDLPTYEEVSDEEPR
jgi:hypothetical protein